MSTWLSIATSTAAGPVCIAVTVIGLYLSYRAWRRKGSRSAMRGVAWSLLPTAAWATHSVHLIGQIGSAIVQFAQSFVFSPKAWIGVVLIVISVLLFLVSGGIPMLQRGRRSKAVDRGQSADGSGAPASVTDKGRGKKAIAPRAKNPAAAGADDDMSDVESILRRHGIS
jgi:hypothetical protein